MKLILTSALTALGLGVSVLVPNLAPNHVTNPNLPPITQRGANTFACVVNGSPWVAQGHDPAPSLVVSYDPSYNGGSLDMAAHNVDGGNQEYIYLNHDRVGHEGEYWFSGKEGVVRYEPSTCDASQTVTSGRLFISKLSIEEHIIAGTFEFTLTNSNCADWVCTEGRFDVRF